MKRYRVEYVVIKEPIWATPFETYIDASNLDEIIQGISCNGKFYITKIWEKSDDGAYMLAYPN